MTPRRGKAIASVRAHAHIRTKHPSGTSALGYGTRSHRDEPRQIARSGAFTRGGGTDLACDRLPDELDLPYGAWRGRRTRRNRIASRSRVLVLGGLARDEPPDDVLMQLRSFADYSFPFPGDVLTEIGAAALTVAGAAPTTPLSLTDATERHLSEWTVSGNTARQKHRAAIQAAVTLHAGIVIDYDEVAGWWRLQDYTLHTFEAAVVLIACRGRAHPTADEIDLRRDRRPTRRVARRPQRSGQPAAITSGPSDAPMCCQGSVRRCWQTSDGPLGLRASSYEAMRCRACSEWRAGRSLEGQPVASGHSWARPAAPDRSVVRRGGGRSRGRRSA